MVNVIVIVLLSADGMDLKLTIDNGGAGHVDSSICKTTERWCQIGCNISDESLLIEVKTI